MKKNGTLKKHPVVPAMNGLTLLTTEVFAQKIAWHPESVRRAIRQGRVAAIKLGNGWRIPPDVADHVLKHGIPLEGSVQS